MKINGRRKYVPEWVMTSNINERRGSKAPLLSFAPRFQIVEPEQRTPACLQDESRFIQAGDTSRCVVHVRTPFVYDKIEQALVNAKQWVANLTSQYGMYFGDVGSADQEIHMLRNMAVAFDWSEIVEKGNSSQRQRDAFKAVRLWLRADLDKRLGHGYSSSLDGFGIVQILCQTVFSMKPTGSGFPTLVMFFCRKTL